MMTLKTIFVPVVKLLNTKSTKAAVTLVIMMMSAKVVFAVQLRDSRSCVVLQKPGGVVELRSETLRAIKTGNRLEVFRNAELEPFLTAPLYSNNVDISNNLVVFKSGDQILVFNARGEKLFESSFFDKSFLLADPLVVFRSGDQIVAYNAELGKTVLRQSNGGGRFAAGPNSIMFQSGDQLYQFDGSGKSVSPPTPSTTAFFIDGRAVSKRVNQDDEEVYLNYFPKNDMSAKRPENWIKNNPQKWWKNRP